MKIAGRYPLEVSQRFDIGFLGGGQLARMSIQAAQRMGLKCLSLDPDPTAPASQIAQSVTGKLSDVERIAEVFAKCDRVTLDNEFILADKIVSACEIANVDPGHLCPTLTSLRTIQDKLLQRQALQHAGVPSPPAFSLESDVSSVMETLGFPMVLKVRFGGYDGKGTRIARNAEELEALRPEWESGGWLAEKFVPFTRELAVMVYLSDHGTGCFPTMETVQVDQVCDLVYPSGTDASAVALAAIEAVDGAGLYGVELFELPDGSIQVNEIAPRPHNTGHYTLDWGGPSQFEQHVRLVMGWPVHSPFGQETCMANLLGRVPSGRHADAIPAALAEPGLFFHWYGKVEAKPGRKMGHINAVGNDCVNRAIRAREAFFNTWSAPIWDAPV